MKRIVITAGPVYGRLDDNKLVSNRVRGIWALHFAGYLAAKGHQVTLVLPDTMPKNSNLDLGTYYSGVPVKVCRHTGFESYRAICNELATEADSMVMAAAVVNWIPAQPYGGKMPTKGYNEGDIIQIPFVLAPHVIDQMKAANPELTLIGCKMLVNAPHDELIEAAYGVLLKAKCNAVVANDMGHGLKQKYVVNQDRSVQVYDNDFESFYANLLGHIEDEHYATRVLATDDPPHYSQSKLAKARETFDQVLQLYRERFTPVEGGRVFGSLLVPIDRDEQFYLTSPREKGGMFTSRDAAIVDCLCSSDEIVHTFRCKATLNAPLLIRVHQDNPSARAVLHLHEQLPGVPTIPYGPPGTVRDNKRQYELSPVFNIEGHGFIACLDDKLEIFGGAP